MTSNLTSVKENRFYSKKKTYGYRERDEAKRQAFIAELSTILPEKIVYVDESGMDDPDQYDYAWNKRGQRFHALKSGRRQGRVNMIAALCQQKLSAPFTIESAGCRLLYLPPYSPDFNKIEQCWSWLKSRIRKQKNQFNCLRDAIEDVLHPNRLGGCYT